MATPTPPGAMAQGPGHLGAAGGHVTLPSWEDGLIQYPQRHQATLEAKVASESEVQANSEMLAQWEQEGQEFWEGQA